MSLTFTATSPFACPAPAATASSSPSVNSTGAIRAFILLLPYILLKMFEFLQRTECVVAPPRDKLAVAKQRSNVFLKWYQNKKTVSLALQRSADSGLFLNQVKVIWRSRAQPGRACDLCRVEFAVFAGDQIIGKREARHRLEAPRPGFERGPIRDLEPAFGHEHHTTPAADIGDCAAVADEPVAVLQRRVDKGQCRLSLWPILRDDFGMRRLEPR